MARVLYVLIVEILRGTVDNLVDELAVLLLRAGIAVALAL